MVLIAGAGPVGLTLAMALARAGVAVRIVDPAASRTDKSKALVLWPRTLELLEIQGCVHDFIAAGMRGAGAHMRAGGKELVHVRFDIARSDFPYALLIPQSETERLLEEALARLGVRVERGVRLESLVQDADGVTAQLARGDGTQESARCEWLAGCDGAHSTVRHAIGAEFSGTTMQSDWALGDVHLVGSLPRDELTICWTDAGVLALFPIVGGRFRIVADVGAANAPTPPVPTLADLQAILSARGPAGVTAQDPVWLSGFRINERKVRDYRSGRVFLAGDAAHIHSPAGGQGMNTGMQDAFNLAWKLALVMRGHAAPALLDSYSPERSAIGDQVLRNAGRLTEIGVTRNPVLQELRNLAVGTLGHLHAVQQRIVDQLTEVDLHYADSPLTRTPHGASRRPDGGERARNLLVTGGDGMPTRLSDLLRTGRFVVLGVGAAPPAVPPELAALAQIATTDGNEHYTPGYVYLVRPDAYVAFSVDADDGEAIIAALRAMAVASRG